MAIVVADNGEWHLPREPCKGRDVLGPLLRKKQIANEGVRVLLKARLVSVGLLRTLEVGRRRSQETFARALKPSSPSAVATTAEIPGTTKRTPCLPLRFWPSCQIKRASPSTCLVARQGVARKTNEAALLLVENLVQLGGFSELGRASRGEVVGVAAHNPQL